MRARLVPDLQRTCSRTRSASCSAAVRRCRRCVSTYRSRTAGRRPAGRRPRSSPPGGARPCAVHAVRAEHERCEGSVVVSVSRTSTNSGGPSARAGSLAGGTGVGADGDRPLWPRTVGGGSPGERARGRPLPPLGSELAPEPHASRTSQAAISHSGPRSPRPRGRRGAPGRPRPAASRPDRARAVLRHLSVGVGAQREDGWVVGAPAM